MRKGTCLFYEKGVTTKTPACEEALKWSRLKAPPLGVPCLAAQIVDGQPFRTDGAPPMCRDCVMFQPEGQPLGLVIFPVEDDEDCLGKDLDLEDSDDFETQVGLCMKCKRVCPHA